MSRRIFIKFPGQSVPISVSGEGASARAINIAIGARPVPPRSIPGPNVVNGETQSDGSGALDLRGVALREFFVLDVATVSLSTRAVMVLKQSLEIEAVDNTPDADKPISTSMQLALAAKQDAGDYVSEGDPRLADARVPTAHSHQINEVEGLASQLSYLAEQTAGKVDAGDSRLTDMREWNAATVTQQEAETGTSETRRAWTAARVFQAIAAWWASSPFAEKLAGVQAGATTNAADSFLLNRDNHTGTQGLSTISGIDTKAAGFLESPTSANLALALTDPVGTGGGFVRSQGAVFDGTPGLVSGEAFRTEKKFARLFSPTDIIFTGVATTFPAAFVFSVEAGKTYRIYSVMTMTGQVGSAHSCQFSGTFNVNWTNGFYRRAGFETQNFAIASTPFQTFGFFNSSGTSTQTGFFEGFFTAATSGLLRIGISSNSNSASVTLLRNSYYEIQEW